MNLGRETVQVIIPAIADLGERAKSAGTGFRLQARVIREVASVVSQILWRTPTLSEKSPWIPEGWRAH